MPPFPSAPPWLHDPRPHFPLAPQSMRGLRAGVARHHSHGGWTARLAGWSADLCELSDLTVDRDGLALAADLIWTAL